MPDAQQLDTEASFTLGRPALVCRWRLAGGALPLENRHLRALSRRELTGGRVSRGLVAWAKQHIEWTLAEGSEEHPDGVLMLVVDEEGRAAMTVGPYESLRGQSLRVLAERAQAAQAEGEETGVAPESLWTVSDGVLTWGIERGAAPSGAATLVEDLARTLGIPVRRQVGLASAVLEGHATLDEAFLVSDEHGVVGALDASGPEGQRFVASYARLLDQTARKHRGAPATSL